MDRSPHGTAEEDEVKVRHFDGKEFEELIGDC
jgi:hypothetical protein